MYIVSIPNKAVDLNLCDEIIKSYDEEIKVIHTNFNEKKVTCKTQSLQILLAFLSIIIALLIVVSIYCCLRKYNYLCRKFWKFWILSKIRDLIRSVTKKSDDYDEEYMKIKFDSDDNLPFKKTVETPIMTIVVRAVFRENNKHYPQFF